MSGGLYLYGIVGAGRGETAGCGLAGEPLRVIGDGPLRAVAGEAEGPPRPEPAALTAHDTVVRRLADLTPALLPARFGQWLPDERSATAWLTAHGPELAEALAQVAGCVQMTLRVFGEPEEAGESAESDKPEPPASGGPGTRYLFQRRQEAERERSLPEIAPLRDALRPLLRGERIERPAAVPGALGRLRASVYDLIARGASGDYNRIVAETAPRLRGFKVTASGPWPPYAFAPGPVR
jgi:hypothetical protein